MVATSASPSDSALSEPVRGSGRLVASLRSRIPGLGYILLAFLYTAIFHYRFRYWWYADSVSYLEIASRYRSHRFGEAIVGSWSPLYSWLLIPVTRAAGFRQLLWAHAVTRSEEHTSELQSLRHLVCRLLLEKKQP